MFEYLAVAIESVGGGHAIRLILPWKWDTCYVDRGSIYGLISFLYDWFLSSTPIVRRLFFSQYFDFCISYALASVIGLHLRCDVNQFLGEGRTSSRKDPPKHDG